MKLNGTYREVGKKAWTTRLANGTASIGKQHPLWGTHRPLKVKEKIRKKLIGKTQSLETISKRVFKNIGKKRTIEQIERLRLGAIKRWTNLSQRKEQSIRIKNKFNEMRNE